MGAVSKRLTEKKNYLEPIGGKMKRTLTAIALTLVLGLGSTVANAGILVADRDGILVADRECTDRMNSGRSKEGIIVFGESTGIIVFGAAIQAITGIIVFGAKDDAPAPCTQQEPGRTKEGIIVFG
jgi:hypothetical protein